MEETHGLSTTKILPPEPKRNSCRIRHCTGTHWGHVTLIKLDRLLNGPCRDKSGENGEAGSDVMS